MRKTSCPFFLHLFLAFKLSDLQALVAAVLPCRLAAGENEYTTRFILCQLFLKIFSFFFRFFSDLPAGACGVRVPGGKNFSGKIAKKLLFSFSELFLFSDQIKPPLTLIT